MFRFFRPKFLFSYFPQCANFTEMDHQLSKGIDRAQIKDFLFCALTEFLLEWMRQMCREHLPRNQRPSEAKDLNKSYSWTFSRPQTVEKGRAAPSHCSYRRYLYHQGNTVEAAVRPSWLISNLPLHTI